MICIPSRKFYFVYEMFVINDICSYNTSDTGFCKPVPIAAGCVWLIKYICSNMLSAWLKISYHIYRYNYTNFA